ncbi:MAG: helix-turn-helix domain-containing protein [Geminicoccaceae bacterium]
MSKEPEPRARGRAARRVIDWHQAAELLARGLTIAVVAERVGCARATLARKRRHDPAFQSWPARCRDAQPEQEGSALADLRDKVHRAIETQVRAGNVRVVLWLADRLKLVTLPSERTPDQELRALLQGLTTEELREFEALSDES